MFDECASFFSSAYCFQLSEEFLVHGYAYVVLHRVNLVYLVYLLYRKALLALLYTVNNGRFHENPPNFG